MIRLGNNEVLKTLTKTLTFVDADTNADANSEGSTIALREPCSGELKTPKKNKTRNKPNGYFLTAGSVQETKLNTD